MYVAMRVISAFFSKTSLLRLLQTAAANIKGAHDHLKIEIKILATVNVKKPETQYKNVKSTFIFKSRPPILTDQLTSKLNEQKTAKLDYWTENLRGMTEVARFV